MLRLEALPHNGLCWDSGLVAKVFKLETPSQTGVKLIRVIGYYNLAFQSFYLNNHVIKRFQGLRGFVSRLSCVLSICSATVWRLANSVRILKGTSTAQSKSANKEISFVLYSFVLYYVYKRYCYHLGEERAPSLNT